MEQRNRIAVVGSANMDVVIPVHRFPHTGETILGGDLGLFPGGKGANQACAAARLGGAVSFIAQIGSDPFGSALTGSLRAAGVDTEHVGTASRPTGCASIYVLPGGENTIVVSPGANATLDAATALSRLGSIAHAGFVLSQLEIPLDTVEMVLAAARARGAVTILDPAPARELPDRVLRSVDYLTPNQSEAAILLGRPSWVIESFADAEEAASGLLRLGVSTVVMKLGALGCLLAAAGVRRCIDGHRVSAIDTTAAGDAFNGAFAAALAEGKPPFEAAEFANGAAAISVTRRGAQISLPCRDEVLKLLEMSTLAG
ncbi:MAG TPA: ribokinase [Bryobacteraceae bacterium]|nr:ribokinase [Bryobacteraceae bacterium]